MKNRILAVVMLAVSSIAFSATLPSLDNLIIHLKADSITGINDGDFVTFWPDSSGTADSVDGTVISVAGQGQPVWNAFSINARPAIEFSSDVLSTINTFSLPNYSGGMTIFAVFTGDNSGTASTRIAQIGSSTGANGQVLGLDVSTNPSSGNGSGYRFNNGYAVTGANNPLTTGFHIAIWKMGQAAQHQTAIYYVDSFVAQTLSCNNPSNKATLPASGNTFALGNGMQNGDWIAGDFYGGQVAEILVYNRQLTTTEMSQLVQYLSVKYFTSFISAAPSQFTLEEGQSSIAQIALTSQPASDVTINVYGTQNQTTASPETLVFTPANWDQPQPIQITVIDDGLLEAQFYQSTVALIAASSDPAFDDARKAVNLTVLENECGLWAYPAGDMNEDCRVDINDLAQLSFHWLWCDPMKDDLCFNLK